MRILILLFIGMFLFSAVGAFAFQKQVNDDTIWNDVRRRLSNDAIVKGGTLEVEVKDGVVTIRGTVESEKVKQRAEKLTGKAKGVKGVKNELKIKTV